MGINQQFLGFYVYNQTDSAARLFIQNAATSASGRPRLQEKINDNEFNGANGQIMLTDTGAVADSHYGEIGFSQGAFSINTMTDLLATTSRMVINNQGNVGIGTTSPASLLSVQGNGLFSGNVSLANLTATGTMNVLGLTTLVNASTTQISVSNTAYFPGSGIWNSSGNVGIGTTTPSSLLDVYSATAAVQGFSGGATKGKWTMGYDVTNNLFAIASSSSITSNVRMVIDNQGNAGIGTSRQKLDVVRIIELQNAWFSGNLILPHRHNQSQNNLYVNGFLRGD